MKLITKELEKRFRRYPLLSQDGKGKEAIVLCKYFHPYKCATWYILEAEQIRLNNNESTWRLYTYAQIVPGVPFEYGYVLLSEIEQLQVIERDLYLKYPTTLGKALKADGYTTV